MKALLMALCLSGCCYNSYEIEWNNRFGRYYVWQRCWFFSTLVGSDVTLEGAKKQLEYAKKHPDGIVYSE